MALLDVALSPRELHEVVESFGPHEAGIFLMILDPPTLPLV
jgi:hypothetical protein